MLSLQDLRRGRAPRAAMIQVRMIARGFPASWETRIRANLETRRNYLAITSFERSARLLRSLVRYQGRSHGALGGNLCRGVKIIIQRSSNGSRDASMRAGVAEHPHHREH